ncbi:MAG TPA: transglutaminase domain-containing protein [Kofleriaceae bacterium]|nr:transglutaminase domain-containing protein [Kofleriaceae bacterium]
MKSAALVVLAACSGAPSAGPVREADTPAAPSPTDAERHYTLWLGGARVGAAHETEAWSPAGLVLRRVEEIKFLRGDVPIAMTTTIEIAADRRLVPTRVTWTERSTTDTGGPGLRRGELLRDGRGWTLAIDDDGMGDQAAEAAPAPDAVPAELVPLLVRRDGAFAGPVFLPARGFVGGAGHVEAIAPGHLVAQYALDRGPTVEATIDLDADGAPARVVDGEGVIAMRATAAQARAALTPVDLIAATSIPLLGHRSDRLWLDGELALPAVPGQAAHPTPTGLELELSPRLPGDMPAGPLGTDRTREIAGLVARVQARISPDLGARAATPRTAASATAGDCTTFALAYAALASRLAIPTRVVTGLRIDGDRLVRHRWAISWTGRTWIAVDAAFGAAPAGGDLIGLAVHDADDAGLIAGEAALTRVRTAGWQ